MSSIKLCTGAGENSLQEFHINVGFGSFIEGLGYELLQKPLSIFVEPSTQDEKFLQQLHIFNTKP